MKIYGDGSIQQLQNVSRYKCKRWRLYVKTECGMRTRHFNGTLREARAALKLFVAELEAEIPCYETFEAYALSWVDDRAASGDFSPNTIEKDDARVTSLCRIFGDDRLQDMTPARVRTGLLELRNGGNATGRVLSGTTAVGLHTTLRAIMEQARTDGLIASNPCDSVKRPKSDTKEKRACGVGDLSGLLDKLDAEPLDGRVMAVYLIACLGLRRGEACGLYWDDIADGCVHVVRAMKEADGTIDEPKSKSGVRTLPMPARLARKIVVWRTVAAYNGFSGDTVCVASNGKPLRPQNLYKWWEAHKAGFGFADMTLHQLRHSNLTAMARNCKSAFDLQYWAGWSSIEPARIYIHKDDGELRRASAMLEL